LAIVDLTREWEFGKEGKTLPMEQEKLEAEMRHMFYEYFRTAAISSRFPDGGVIIKRIDNLASKLFEYHDASNADLAKYILKGFPRMKYIDCSTRERQHIVRRSICIVAVALSPPFPTVRQNRYFKA
jgi:hypothetical protein